MRVLSTHAWQYWTVRSHHPQSSHQQQVRVVLSGLSCNGRSTLTPDTISPLRSTTVPGQQGVSGKSATASEVQQLAEQLTMHRLSPAGILLTLCEADVKHRELVCKAKAVASNACQVLHGCLSDPQAVPRHVVALLACLASDITVSDPGSESVGWGCC